MKVHSIYTITPDDWQNRRAEWFAGLAAGGAFVWSSDPEDAFIIMQRSTAMAWAAEIEESTGKICLIDEREVDDDTEAVDS